MNSQNLLVSVVIVTWNRHDDVLEAVQSVYDQTYPDFEIIVVDNGSSDGTLQALRRDYPAVRLIPHDHNLGAIKGRNVGTDAAKGDVVFFLDSDASLGKNTLASVVDRLLIEPDIGAINSKVVNATTRKVADGPGWMYSQKARALQDTEFVSWGFSETGVAIRKEVLDRAGQFWEPLFFGFSGQELSLRIWDAGYKVIYFPKSIVYHRVSPQMRFLGGIRDCMYLKSALSMYLVRYPWWTILVFLPPKVLATLIRGGRRGYLPKVIGALFELLQQMPDLLRQRRPIRHSTALHSVRLQRQHGALSWDLVTWLKHKT